MKKILALIVLFSSFLFGQEWNTTVTNVINEPTIQKIDNFSNSSGIHVLIKRSNGNIVYYKLNSSGSIVLNSTLLESEGDFPAITGSNDKIYAFYRVGTFIKGKYSTNGSSWTTLPNNITISSNECSGIDAVYGPDYQYGNGVHIAYSLLDGDPYFETYYYFLRSNSDPPFQWVNSKQVTDYQYEIGGRPSIVLSTDRIHISYNTNPTETGATGEIKTRDKTGLYWQTPLSAVYYPHFSSFEKLIVRENLLFLFYIESDEPSFDLRYKTRNLNGTWSSSYTTLSSDILVPPFDLCRTNNDNIHIIYFTYTSGLNYRSYNGTWNSPISLDPYPNNDILSISLVSNDLYTVWRHTGNYLYYEQYDDIPLPPINLTVSENQNTHHPDLSWVKVEPDIDFYEIDKNITTCDPTWHSFAQTSNTSYTDQNELYCTAKPPEECPSSCSVGYRLIAFDYSSYYSEPTDPVTAYVTGHYPQKRVQETTPNIPLAVYKLEQNYPNPFNPNTSIYYSLKKEGWVNLKIYNMLGQVVAELVNEKQSEGYHSVEFNTFNLPSGIYIYKIISGKFTDIKKMNLIK
jgi:hypothetical protein